MKAKTWRAFCGMSLLLCTATALYGQQKATFSVPPIGNVIMPVPEGWIPAWKAKGVNVLTFTSESGRSFEFLLTWRQPGENDDRGSALESKVKEYAKTLGAQSVEKSVEIKELKGTSAHGYYFALTDAAPKPGEFTYLVQGLIDIGPFQPNFTLLHNDPSGAVAKQALELLAGAVFSPNAKGWIEIRVPRQSLILALPNLGWNPVLQDTRDAYFIVLGHSKSGQHLSIFVEEPATPGRTHQDVATYYWSKSKKNPTIDPDTVKLTPGKRFVKVAYQAGGIQNVNYFFAVQDHWIDVHVSGDPAMLDEFDKGFDYRAAANPSKN